MKASNIFQKLKTQGFGTDGSKPVIPGIKTPLSMKDSPLNKALVGNQKNLPEHLKAKIKAAPESSPAKLAPAVAAVGKKLLVGAAKKMIAKKAAEKLQQDQGSPAMMYKKASPAKKYKSDAQRKAVHASKAEKKSPMKAKGDNGKSKEVKAQSITTDLKAGTRTRYFSEEDQKKYGVPAQITSKIVKSSPAKKYKTSPAKKSCSPMKMETETMAGPGNPKKAMRKAKRRATKATNVMQRAMNACKRNTRGSGSTYRN